MSQIIQSFTADWLNDLQAHAYGSAEEMLSAEEQCCDLQMISNTESCCNGRGYNPALQVCADVGDGNVGGCGDGTVCFRGQCWYSV